MVWPRSSFSGSGGLKRRDPFLVRVRRFFRVVLWICGCLALAAAGALCARHVHHFIYTSGYFKIETIRVTGASPPLEKDARAWLAKHLTKTGDNLCLLRKDTLAAGLSCLARAKSARVRKIYPQTLQIEFSERQPLIVANLDRLYLVDEEGVLIAETHEGAIRRWNLPILTGIRGSSYHPGDQIRQAHLPELLGAVKFIRRNDPSLHKKIVEWNLNGREEITAILGSRTEVRFGNRPPLELLDKLSAALLGKKELEKATYIDLRMARQIVYK